MSLGGGCLPLDHFLFRLDLPLAAHLEECFGPNFIFELDAIHRVVFVIFVRANPLVVNVRELLFQICPALVALFHGFLGARQRRNRHQCRYKQYANLCHYESPWVIISEALRNKTTFAWSAARARPDLPW